MLEDGWLDEADLTDERFLLPEVDPVLVRVDEMNERHAVIQVGGRTLIIQEDQRSDGSLDVAFLRPAEVRAWYANIAISVVGRNGETTFKKIFDVWFYHPSRRQYERVELAPEGAGPQVYNLWRGFAFVPNSAGRCTLFLWHLREIVCRGGRGALRVAAGFLRANDPVAWIETRRRRGPARRAGGRQIDCGEVRWRVVSGSPRRGLAARPPRWQVQRASPESFAPPGGRSVLGGRQKRRGRAEAPDHVRHFAHRTEGCGPFAVRSIARLLITSNAYWVVPAGPDERRYAVFDVSDARQQDTTYFAALSSEMENGGRAALLSFLRGYNLSKIDLRKIPKTEALLEQKLANLPLHAQWWLGCLREAVIGSAGDWPSEVSKNEMYRLYAEHVRQQQRGFKQNEAVFFKELLEMMPPISEVRLARSAGRQRVWVIPNLSENRQAFERWINQPINWDL